jgi:hypothetical protein
LLSKEELESLDGTGLFTRNVNDGNVQKDTMSNLEIDRVEIVKGDAYASLTREGVPAQGANFRFVPEDGLWKFDFERWQSYAEPAMAQARVRRKLDKVGLAMAFLRDPATGMPLTDKVLAGPLYATAKDRPPPLITDEERKAITGSEKTADPGKSRQAGKPGSSKKK